MPKLRVLTHYEIEDNTAIPAICRAYNVTMQDVTRINNIPSPNTIIVDVACDPITADLINADLDYQVLWSVDDE